VYLLQNNANVNLSDVNKRTALMFAASGPFPEVVRMLLDGIELYQGLREYFDYYNHQQAHQGIGRKIPGNN